MRFPWLGSGEIFPHKLENILARFSKYLVAYWTIFTRMGTRSSSSSSDKEALT